jgi:hypothetical protein
VETLTRRKLVKEKSREGRPDKGNPYSIIDRVCIDISSEAMFGTIAPDGRRV